MTKVEITTPDNRTRRILAEVVRHKAIARHPRLVECADELIDDYPEAGCFTYEGATYHVVLDEDTPRRILDADMEDVQLDKVPIPVLAAMATWSFPDSQLIRWLARRALAA